MSFLDDILASRRAAVVQSRSRIDESQLISRAKLRPPPRDFANAISTPGMSVIAEFKRASPSRGPIAPGRDAGVQAKAYADGGAAAISVLVEPEFFDGSPHDLSEARGASGLPVLWKDFVIDPWQVIEARTWDADAVLVIVRILDDETLGEVVRRARAARMTAVLEVFDEADVDRALGLQPEVIGINNRDLQTFEEDASRVERLRPSIPSGVAVCGFSTISSREDVEALEAIGVDAVLVGESLMRASDPAARIRELLGT